MNDILLSVCIPTYNRSEKLMSRIQEVLVYTQSDIEIVVLDNCSTDDTEQKIKDIEDERVVYYRNKKCLPPPVNWIEVFKYAKGKYAYHLNDRDHLHGDLLNEFLNILRSNEDVACGYCKFGKKKKVAIYRGVEARKHIPFTGYHVSGILVNLEMLRNNFSIDSYQYRTIQGQPNVEPHITMLYDLATKGGYCSYSSPMSYNARQDEINCVSGVISGKNDNLKGRMWFEPPYVFDLFSEIVDKIEVDNALSKHEKGEVLTSGLECLLKSATVVYGLFMLSDLHRTRYGVSRYYIHFWDLERIMLDLINQFRKRKETNSYRINYFKVIWVAILRILKFKVIYGKRIISNNISYRKENE